MCRVQLQAAQSCKEGWLHRSTQCWKSRVSSGHIYPPKKGMVQSAMNLVKFSLHGEESGIKALDAFEVSHAADVALLVTEPGIADMNYRDFFQTSKGWDKITTGPIVRCSSQNNMTAKNLQIGEQIGAGGYGNVYKGTWFGADVAVKAVWSETNRTKGIQEGEREVHMSTKIQHPNIVQIHDCMIVEVINASQSRLQHKTQKVISTSITHIIVMEIGSKGTLQDMILKNSMRSQNQHSSIGWMRIVLSLLLDIANGLLSMHNSRIIHGDLKPSNIILFPSDNPHGYEAKIGDFGLSQVLPDGSEWISVDFCGTLSHSSPDYLHHGTLSTAADVYAFGMVMWEMIHEEVPYQDHPNKVYAVWNKEPLDFTVECSEAYQQLSMRCMDPHREARPSMTEVIQGLQLQAASAL